MLPVPAESVPVPAVMMAMKCAMFLAADGGN